MKLTHLHIQNFRSCKEVYPDIGNMHALVSANNAGKSSILRALDFLFNPSAKLLNKESFWNKETSLEIPVEAVFSDLTIKEKEALGAYRRDFFTWPLLQGWEQEVANRSLIPNKVKSILAADERYPRAGKGGRNHFSTAILQLLYTILLPSGRSYRSAIDCAVDSSR